MTRTGPFTHNGEFATLDDVYRFYALVTDRAPAPALRRERSPRRPDAAAVTAFLAGLSDGTVDTRVPTRVPSGLPVGGSFR